MIKEFTNKHICRCCGSRNLIPYLNLGNQPLANSYHKNDIEQKYYPLIVNVCNDCFNSQLSIVVDPEVMFKHYLYVSGTTKTFKSHCATLAKETLNIVGIDNPNVLDIACNDGTLLNEFKLLGSNVYGVDPAENIREISKEKGFDVCVDFWNETSSKFFGVIFDIITATNVFAHVDDVDTFLNLSKNVLSDLNTYKTELETFVDNIKGYKKASKTYVEVIKSLDNPEEIIGMPKEKYSKLSGQVKKIFK
jgi:SAM-dependent methyltransferase